MILRTALPNDAAALLEIYAPFVLHTPASFLEEVPTVEEFAQTISSYTSTHPWIVAEEQCEGERIIAGYAYASKLRERAAYRWSAESSVYIADGYRQRGIGRILYAALFDVLRLQDFATVYAGVTLPNAASEKLHQACGFTSVGIYRKVGYKFGAWHDVGWFQLALDEYPTQPAEPQLFSTIEASSIQHIYNQHQQHLSL